MVISNLAKHEMTELYHKVWLNCRVSREESSPVSILESMICEVPQVTSTVVAKQIPIIQNGKTGFVLEPDDTSGLVRALRTLLANPILRDEMGRECRKRALEYSFDNRVDAFEHFLR
jgi:glycosyltransferase involved in cell wall biosynthesis